MKRQSAVVAAIVAALSFLVIASAVADVKIIPLAREVAVTPNAEKGEWTVKVTFAPVAAGDENLPEEAQRVINSAVRPITEGRFVSSAIAPNIKGAAATQTFAPVIGLRPAGGNLVVGEPIQSLGKTSLRTVKRGPDGICTAVFGEKPSPDDVKHAVVVAKLMTNERVEPKVTGEGKERRIEWKE